MKQSDIKIGKKVRIIDTIGHGFYKGQIVECIGQIEDIHAIYRSLSGTIFHQWVKHTAVEQIILSINKSIKTL